MHSYTRPALHDTTNYAIQLIEMNNAQLRHESIGVWGPADLDIYHQPAFVRKLKADPSLHTQRPPISAKAAAEAQRGVEMALCRYECKGGKTCPGCGVATKQGKQNPCGCLEEARKMIAEHIATGQSGRPTPQKMARKFGPST